jgi:putative FmdB family regulatory protein
MPIYDYKCSKCGHVFEVLQTKNVSTEKCEKCGSKSKKQPAMRVGLVFKGSGFYVNDYGKKSSGTEGQKNGNTEKGLPPAKASGAGVAEGQKTVRAEGQKDGSTEKVKAENAKQEKIKTETPKTESKPKTENKERKQSKNSK